MNQLLIALAGLVVAATPVVVAFLKAKLGPQKLGAIAQLAGEAVLASEKIGQAEGVSSADQYKAAEAFLIAAAKRVGVRLSTTEANGFIQSALFQLQLRQGK